MSLTLWESLPREAIRVAPDALSREIAVPAARPGAVSLSAAERLAARFYADLTTLAGPTGEGLRRALAGRPLDTATGYVAGAEGGFLSDPAAMDPLADDPRLALRLMAADIEQLWRDQLIGAAALALITFPGAGYAGSIPPGGDPATARCLLVYRVRPWSPTPDALGADLPAHAPELPAALPARLPRGRLVLLLSWTPAVARRSWVFPRQVYTFQWEPVSAVSLERATVQATDDEDDADAGEWMICRPRRPSVLR